MSSAWGSGLNSEYQERHLHVDGIILQMEFLHPAIDDADHVILLMITAR